MKNINFADVEINNGFWKSRQDIVRDVTAFAVYERFKETHRFDALNCDWQEGQPDMPHIFWDSDVAKWIEGVAYILEHNECPELEKIADDSIEKIIKNSDENGYFNSHYLVHNQNERFMHRNNHELYCFGHLIEAAVAYKNATGKDAFLKAMCRYADYVEKVFKIENSAAFATPGHPELELALVKLYRATGEKRYLELSKHFIDLHGNNSKDEALSGDVTLLYNQDEMPVRQRSTVEGHSVRAFYLLSGMADIAAEYGDEELKKACERCFDNAVNKRMYITGGVGSTAIGEAFTVDYDLPNRKAYAETCAAISLAYFAHRMQCFGADSKYADIIERVIYNGALSGISMDGRSFFYVNPLEIDPASNNINPATTAKENFPITQRVEVFGCSCCPPNILRFISSIGDYIYSYDDDTVFVNQYMASRLSFEGGEISQSTDYPASGSVKISCNISRKRIALRIPDWCISFKLNMPYTLKNGYAYIDIAGESEILLELDMPVTVIASNRCVHENAGRVAVTRGPVVYCVEGVDNGCDLKSVFIISDSEFKVCDNEFLLPSLETVGYRPEESEQLYYTAKEGYEEIKLRFIPYYAFANRGETEMLIWILEK